MHDEQEASVGTLSIQSNDCQSSKKNPIASYDIDMVMKTRKTDKKIL